MTALIAHRRLRFSLLTVLIGFIGIGLMCMIGLWGSRQWDVQVRREMIHKLFDRNQFRYARSR